MICKPVRPNNAQRSVGRKLAVELANSFVAIHSPRSVVLLLYSEWPLFFAYLPFVCPTPGPAYRIQCMKLHLEIKRLTFGTVFKLTLIGYFIPIVCLGGIGDGVLALFGQPTVHINYRVVTGISGLIAAIIIAPIFWFIWSFGNSCVLFVSLWLYSLVRPIWLKYIPIMITLPGPA
jgi:hypothetical protein